MQNEKEKFKTKFSIFKSQFSMKSQVSNSKQTV
jgi:hypothetical protein